MKYVNLSSTYYLDPAVQDLSPNGERFLTRALAQCANAETRGILTKSAANMLGIPSPIARVRELVSAGILLEISPTSWQFKAWDDWNESANNLLQRRENERARQRRHRAKKHGTDGDESRDESRDEPRDVTAPKETKLEIPTDVGIPSPTTTPAPRPVDDDGFAYDGDLLDEPPQSPKSDAKTEPPRPDVDALCERLHDRIVANGNRAGKITDAWKRAARLLLDKDGVTVAQAEAVVDWCQADEFWAPNILSMPTFRKQYPKLEAKARAAHRAKHSPSPASNAKQSQRDALDAIVDGFMSAAPGPSIHTAIMGAPQAALAPGHHLQLVEGITA